MVKRQISALIITMLLCGLIPGSLYAKTPSDTNNVSAYFVEKMEDLFSNPDRYEVEDATGNNIREEFLRSNMLNYQEGNYQEIWEYTIDNVSLFIKTNRVEVPARLRGSGYRDINLEKEYTPILTDINYGASFDFGYYLRATYTINSLNLVINATKPTIHWVYNRFDDPAFRYEITYPERSTSLNADQTIVTFRHSFKLIASVKPTSDTPYRVYEFPVHTDVFQGGSRLDL